MAPGDVTAPVRVAIVDDEPDARERLRALLERRPEVRVVAECVDGADAVRALAERAGGDDAPELLFLDVQMPELDGFAALEGLADALGTSALPAVVFVTAFDAYALQAFDVSAADYLLKPYDRERFARALDRGVARARAARAARAAQTERGDGDMRALLALVRRERAAERFVVRRGGRIYFVRAADVDWLDAEGNYVRLHAGGAAHLVRDTLGAVESRLDPERFVRVHRSAIVNIDRVASLEPYFHGEYVVTMRDGTKLTSSRTYSARLRALLK
ncbi:LytTr DNA-binding region (plasmid) [Gemmatirosa kalamazoonensis]|uniref:LytTr DNA-binding region n=1 Tax=Gemmatirosa kalamazoonensis TaxID=861299 RepID=W0RRM9_9BACT|nr:LytTR family DNA-binding domain-containing protein [Gemmatirosa kalamazoonensis]AHG93644.1 LytTr DNA-binding region [Gemmatirosa kalamazoonensis]